MMGLLKLAERSATSRVYLKCCPCSRYSNKLHYRAKESFTQIPLSEESFTQSLPSKDGCSCLASSPSDS